MNITKLKNKNDLERKENKLQRDKDKAWLNTECDNLDDKKNKRLTDYAI